MVINSSFHIPPCASNFSKLIVSISVHSPYIIYSAQEVKRLHDFLIFSQNQHIFKKAITDRNHESADKLPNSASHLNCKIQNNISAFRRFCCRTRLLPVSSSKCTPCNVCSSCPTPVCRLRF